MYAVDWTALLSRTPRNRSASATCPDGAPAGADGAVAQKRWVPRVSKTVWALGLTSLFTDVSSEMVASVLPMYLVLQLGMQPFAFGIIDGLYQGFAALVRVASGVIADRLWRHKELATVGYSLSAVCRPALLIAGSAWPVIAGIVAVDRIGKGIRTAPRDALISLRSPSRDLATAFGVHRSLDAAGAMLGPLIAFLMLAAMPRRFDLLFAVSFAVALVGVGIILTCVEPVKERPQSSAAPNAGPRALEVFRSHDFRAIVLAGLVLGLPTMSDAFIFLALQQQLQVGVMAFPLFYVGTSLFTAMFSMPFGRLADRFGRTTVLLGGHVLLALVYVTLFVPQAPVVAVVVTLALLGAYYAASDGVLTAMAASVLAPSASGTGLSLLATATNVSRLTASVLFGFLWSRAGLGSAIAVYLVALTAAIVCAGIVLFRTKGAATDSRA